MRSDRARRQWVIKFIVQASLHVALSLNLIDKSKLARIETMVLFGYPCGVKLHLRALRVLLVSTARLFTHDVCRCAVWNSCCHGIAPWMDLLLGCNLVDVVSGMFLKVSAGRVVSWWLDTVWVNRHQVVLPFVIGIWLYLRSVETLLIFKSLLVKSYVEQGCRILLDVDPLWA